MTNLILIKCPDKIAFCYKCPNISCEFLIKIKQRCAFCPEEAVIYNKNGYPFCQKHFEYLHDQDGERKRTPSANAMWRRLIGFI